KEGPVIVVSNHQNGLMDPVMCCLSTRRQLHFLTRADVFKKPSVRAILTKLNMMPVYRPHDKVSNMPEKNEHIFQTCVERLKIGSCIALFPEGNHGNKYLIRPMKKGLSRLVYRSIAKYPELEEIKIVPMGIHYSNYQNFRANFDVRVGTPISVKDWIQDHDDSPSSQMALMQLVKERLREVCWDLAPSNNYQLLHDTARQLESENEGWNQIRKVTQSPQKLESNSEGLDDLVESRKSLLPATKKTPTALQFTEGKPLSFIGKLGILLFTPLAMLGYLIHGLPCWITQQMVRKNIKDPHFTSSFKMVFGLLLIPLFNFIILLCLGFTFGWKSMLVFLGASIVSGIIALRYYDALTDHLGYRRRKALIKNQQQVYDQWKGLTQEALSRLNQAVDKKYALP
ncbi:MAG: 1-acyl-sn-glycerol-3-phosphate acyltransferase, partial [Bacteroidota bacterium]